LRSYKWGVRIKEETTRVITSSYVPNFDDHVTFPGTRVALKNNNLMRKEVYGVQGQVP